MATSKQKEVDVTVIRVERGRLTFNVLGTTPLLNVRLSQKTGANLFLPPRPKNKAEKASTLKHNPYEEFRDSPYTIANPKAPTFLAVPAVWFKKCIAGVAVDLPGQTRAQMERLIWAEGELLPLYGVPKIHMATVRNADVNRTPDIRTRLIVPEWACQVTITYTKPLINETAVVNLAAAAGLMQGVGDWRPQKGSGRYGQFEMVGASDKKFKKILASGGRKAQLEAMEFPSPYDEDTEYYLSFFEAETARRGMQLV